MTHPAARPGTDLSDHRVIVVLQSVATILAALMLVTCGGGDSTPTTPPPPPTPRVTTVVVTPNSATLVTAGETVQLTASALDQNGATMTGQSFTWSSSDDGVVTVSSSGRRRTRVGLRVRLRARGDDVRPSGHLDVGLR
ncbi:MAG: Ig-like domain-containing protein [Gemmatimonadetes bacterium]|nr:Ig-like domain-containing protein [Gemmatimonadota bacterium]